MIGTPFFFQLQFLLSVVASSKFRPSLRLEDLNSSSLMLPVNSDSFSSNSLNEEANLDARIARVRQLLGQFEAEEQDLFADLQSLPRCIRQCQAVLKLSFFRNAALRKLNDLIKRARLAKVLDKS